jgi:hypothetical protein
MNRSINVVQKVSKWSAAFFFMILLGSCAQINPCGFDKDQYMDNFQAFMEKAGDLDPKKTKESTWSQMDDQFEKFSETCFNEWEKELSFGQKAKVATWILKYQYIRHGKPLLEN